MSTSKVKSNIISASRVILSGGGNLEDTISVLTTKVNDTVSKTNGGTFNNNITIDKQDGTAEAVGISGIILGNDIPSGTEGNSKGALVIYGENNRRVALTAGTPTTHRSIELPDKAGTIALTSDLTELFSHLPQYIGYTGQDDEYTYDFSELSNGVYVLIASSLTTGEAKIAFVYKNNAGCGKTWESYANFIKTLTTDSITVTATWYTRYYLIFLCA